LTIIAASASASDDKPLTVNWYHGAEFFQPVIDAFVEESGIPVTVTSDYDTFTTDVIMVSDYKGLLEGKHYHQFKKFDEDFWNRMSKIVPVEWRDDGGYWLGYAVRIRTALINPNTVSEEERPRSYFDLADPKWKGRMTQRSADNVYNRSMVAYLVSRYGEKAATDWARGVVDNVGDGEYLNDVEEAFAVSKGEYDIGFSNTYYLGYVPEWYVDEPETLKALEQNLEVAWLDGNHGVFGNVTGVAISSWIEDGDEKQKKAQALIEFLLSKRGQELMSQHVFKYPVRADAEPGEFIKHHGTFKLDPFNVNDLRYHYDTADRILRDVGWEGAW
jgi:iron(III) transport system substrate-binding protein